MEKILVGKLLLASHTFLARLGFAAFVIWSLNNFYLYVICCAQILGLDFDSAFFCQIMSEHEAHWNSENFKIVLRMQLREKWCWILQNQATAILGGRGIVRPNIGTILEIFAQFREYQQILSQFEITTICFRLLSECCQKPFIESCFISMMTSIVNSKCMM